MWCRVLSLLTLLRPVQSRTGKDWTPLAWLLITTYVMACGHWSREADEFLFLEVYLGFISVNENTKVKGSSRKGNNLQVNFTFELDRCLEGLGRWTELGLFPLLGASATSSEWLLNCRLGGAPKAECCHTGCSGSLWFLTAWFSLCRHHKSHELALLTCVFFPLTLFKINCPLSAVWVFLFPLIYGGKELVWEDESEVIELQGDCISWHFLSLFLPCTVSHSYQCFGLPGNMC